LDYDDAVRERIDKECLKGLVESRGETTHFSVMDGDGMAVSVTASVNAYYGARAANPELGFVYNDYMHEFELGVDGQEQEQERERERERERPYALGPAALPYSSMSPTIVTRDGELQLVLGSPGSARIVSTVAQVIQAWVDGGQDIAAAVEASRVHVGPSNELYLESRDGAVEALLTAEGFRLVEPRADLANDSGNPYFGGVHAIGVGPAGWVGVADPRRDGAARARDTIGSPNGLSTTRQSVGEAQ
jgi:gamma-glutamyltranspeptidase/glutathione hydrolase